jgi:hypothetical protein
MFAPAPVNVGLDEPRTRLAGESCSSGPRAQRRPNTKRAYVVAFAVAILTPAGLSAQQVFLGNLHSYTSFSDGSGLPEEAGVFT